MRIFLISPTESALTRRGRRHPQLAAALAERGCEVVYLSTDFYHAEKRHFSREEIAKGTAEVPYEVRLFHVPAYGDNVSFSRIWGYVTLAWRAFFFLLRRMKKGDLLLAPCRPPELLAVGWGLKLLKKITFVMDVRDVWPDGLPAPTTLPHHLFYAYCRVLNRLFAGSADYAFYTACGFTDWLFRFVPREKCLFVPLGFVAKRWEGSRTLSEADFPGGTIKLVFVGDLSKVMDVTDFVRAVAGLPGYTLTFIGGGERLQETQGLVKSLGFGNIDFLGRLTPEETVCKLAEYHISIVPLNVKYSMPNKLFDALGACRPLLVFGQNDAADFAVKEGIGWSLPFSQESSECFLRDLTVAQIIAASARIGEIREAYSQDCLYKKMMDALFECADRNRI